MKVTTLQDRLIELFDEDPRNDTAIAAELGVSKQTVSAWRNGTRSPKKPMLLRICDLYHVGIEWLMGYDVDRLPSVSRVPVIIPNSDQFVKIAQAMTPEDYQTVMRIFEKTYNKLKERGEI